MVLLVLQPYMVLADLKTGGSQVWLLCGGQVFKPGSRVVVRFWWVVRFSKLNTVLGLLDRHFLRKLRYGFILRI